MNNPSESLKEVVYEMIVEDVITSTQGEEIISIITDEIYGEEK